MRKAGFIGLVLVAAVLMLPTAQAHTQDYLGEWVNIDPNTRGLTKLVVFNDGNSWRIQAWDRCHPQDCDWKAVDLLALSSAAFEKSFIYGFAEWEHGFATRYMTLSKDGEFLVVEMVTIYNGKDGRSNTKVSERLRRIV
jgi:hypothetical protein